MMNIVIENLTKRYGETTALDNISLTFEEGKIYGLLGRNGAGKTTLLRCITGAVFPDEGEINMGGEKVCENDASLCRMYRTSEETFYPEGMKVRDVFKWTKEFYPAFDMENALDISKQFGLNINKKVRALSTGFKSISKLVVALSVNTPFVFFDEPILGLDANNRDLFYRLLLEKYSEKPFCAVISTHLIEEVSTIIEKVVIIKEGRIIRNSDCEKLLSEGYSASGSAAAVDEYAKDKNIIGSASLGGYKTVYICGEAGGGIPDGIEISKLDLQKLFIQLTNS